MVEALTQITVLTTTGKASFVGKYRPDLEKGAWHYYEDQDGNLLHFRKEYMIAVLEGRHANFTYIKMQQ